MTKVGFILLLSTVGIDNYILWKLGGIRDRWIDLRESVKGKERKSN